MKKKLALVATVGVALAALTTLVPTKNIAMPVDQDISKCAVCGKSAIAIHDSTDNPTPYCNRHFQEVTKGLR